MDVFLYTKVLVEVFLHTKDNYARVYRDHFERLKFEQVMGK